ncbi:PAS domain S-box protein [Desulfonatronum sp. SC1]|uniref:PAS domain S-box protein n=1 Tax=Desulfonatronum sp. SC1 TaxID=2109626 RepID=UPI00130493D6|nr:PAS domain S-box protein [Desulfonatronum sp. SC1]
MSVLRRLAEERLAESGRSFEEFSPDQVKALVHDYHVRQIELELQNEELRDAQVRLRVARDRYAKFFNEAPVGYLTITRRGVIKETNATFATMVGLSPDQLFGKALSDFLLPEDRPSFYGRFKAFFKMPEGKQLDFSLTGKDKPINVRCIGRMEHDPRDQPDAEDIESLMLVITDVTEQAKLEEQLRAKETFLNGLFETIPMPVFYKDRHGRYQGFNKAFEDFFGKSKDQLVGKTVFDISPPELARLYHAKDAELFEKPGVQVYEAQVTDARGGAHDVVFHKAALVDEWGSVSGLVGTVQNVTELKLVEMYRGLSVDVLAILNATTEFSESIRRVLLAVKQASGCDAVGIRLQDQGDYPYYEQAGFSEDFLLMENSLIAHDEQGGICRDPDGAIKLECTCGLVISGKVDPRENSMFTPGGSCWTNDAFPILDLSAADDPRLNPRNRCIHDGYSSVALIPIRKSQEIVGLLQLNHRAPGKFNPDLIAILEGIASHIGEALFRKKIEKDLQESEERYRLLSDLTMEGVVLHKGGIVRDVNVAMEKSLGYGREELLGKNLLELIIHEEDRENVRENIVKDYAAPYIVRCVKKNGEVIFTEIEARNFEAQGELLRVAAIRDVTERKKGENALLESRERLRQALAEKDRFFSIIAHDLKSPMSGLLSLSRMFAEDAENWTLKELREISGNLHKSAERVFDLLENLLEWARMQQGLIEYAPRECRLTDIVDANMHFLTSVAEQKDIVLSSHVSKDLTAWLDPSMISTVLRNLLSNAIKFTKREGKVEVRAERQGSRIEVSVHDDGIGMDQKMLSRLFSLDQRTARPGTEGESSTGLGLMLCKDFVEKHGGEIRVESRSGQGTGVFFTLPVDRQ